MRLNKALWVAEVLSMNDKAARLGLDGRLLITSLHLPIIMHRRSFMKLRSPVLVLALPTFVFIVAGPGAGAPAVADPAPPSTQARLDKLQLSVDSLADSVGSIDTTVNEIHNLVARQGAIRAGTLVVHAESQYANCVVFNVGSASATFQVYLYDAGPTGSQLKASIQDLSVGPEGANHIGSIGPFRQAWCYFVPNSTGATFRAYLQVGNIFDDGNNGAPTAVIEAR